MSYYYAVQRVFDWMSSKQYRFALCLFLLVFLMKLPIITMPLHWDDLDNYMAAAMHIYKHGFGSISSYGPNAGGHPPCFFVILALAWRLFGYSIWISHLVVIVIAFLGVYFTYLLGAELQDKKTGLIGALFLLVSPLYFAQAGTLNLDLLTAVLMTSSAYYLCKGKQIGYVFSGVCLVLTKIAGVLFIFCGILYSFLIHYRNPKVMLRKMFIHVSILIVFALWLIYQKSKVGWIVPPAVYIVGGIDRLSFSLQESGEILVIALKSVFFDKGRFILTLIILFSFIPVGINKFQGVSTTRRALRDKRFLLLFLFMFFGLLFYSWFIAATRCLLPRYLIVFYPFYFVIGAACLVNLFETKKLALAVITIAMLCFSVSNWFGRRTDAGVFLEANLEYLSQIKTHRRACNFIEENYPASIVLTSWPQRIELSSPWLGYVKVPIKFICVFNAEKPQKAAEGIKADDFDLVYYSDQSHERVKMRQFIQKFNLKLLVSYSDNGKIAEVFKVVKE